MDTEQQICEQALAINSTLSYPLTLFFTPDAQYPARYFNRGITGEVKTEITIDKCGRVIDIKVLENTQTRSKFIKSSLKAIKNYQFIPKYTDGESEAVLTYQHTVMFALSRRESNSDNSLEQLNRLSQPMRTSAPSDHRY